MEEVGKRDTYNVIAAASESDNKEAYHSLVNCVGLLQADGGKDHYFCKSTHDSINGSATDNIWG